MKRTNTVDLFDTDSTSDNLIPQKTIQTQTLDVFVRTDHLEEDVGNLLKQVRSILPVPEESEITYKRNTIGTINFAFVVTIGNIKLMIRIMGSDAADKITDRTREFHVLLLGSTYGFGPKIYARWLNGYAAEYIEGNALEVEQIAEPFFSAKIAAELAKWHNLKLVGYESALQAIIWDTIEKWTKMANEQKIDVQEILQEIQEIKKQLDTPEYHDVVFVHSDLNHGNIIYNPEDNRLVFVDYEFTGYNIRYLDIANHFCEWAGLKLNFAYYPTKEKQLFFIKNYLEALRKFDPNHKECEEELYYKVNKFSLVSHLKWALWGKLMEVMAPNKELFDYEDYSRRRLAQYYATKKSVLEEKKESCKV